MDCLSTDETRGTFIFEYPAKMDRITITLREFFTGINMIRAFDNQSYEEKRTNKSFADYANQMIKVNRIFAWVTPIAFCSWESFMLLFCGLAEIL